MFKRWYFFNVLKKLKNRLNAAPVVEGLRPTGRILCFALRKRIAFGSGYILLIHARMQLRCNGVIMTGHAWGSARSFLLS